jgi:hypothetical protein
LLREIPTYNMKTHEIKKSGIKNRAVARLEGISISVKNW